MNDNIKKRWNKVLKKCFPYRSKIVFVCLSFLSIIVALASYIAHLVIKEGQLGQITFAFIAFIFFAIFENLYLFWNLPKISGVMLVLLPFLAAFLITPWFLIDLFNIGNDASLLPFYLSAFIYNVLILFIGIIYHFILGKTAIKKGE